MRLGAYQLARQIGAGGMGEVWIAHRLGPAGTRQPVAIKRLPRRLAGDPNYRRILLEEARLSALLHHPNIVHTIEAGEADGEVFIAMELIDGLDLSRVTKLLALQGERLPIPVAAYVVVEVLRGLAYAHDLEHEGELISLVHRDVSPHNVMLSSNGAVKLADFGVARLSSEDTSGTHVKGKARYMPPEQLRGDSRSPTVDLFAVGAVLHELLDGSVFRGDAVDDARLLGMAIDGVVPPLSRADPIPAELELVRRRLLEPDPKQRLRSARQTLDLLLRWPGYRPCPDQLATLVLRLRQHETELVGGNTQTGLAHQATFLHTNDLQLDGSERLELASVVEAPDQILLALAAEASESKTRIPNHPVNSRTDGTLGSLDRTDGGPASTGSQRAPARDPSLALDLSGESFARHVPTSPNPIVPLGRRLSRPALWLAGMLGAGLAIAYAFDVLPPQPDPPEPPPLRDARVVGRGSLLDLGLRDPGMNRMLDDHILFDYRPDPDADPLTMLARGEAEFALTSLDAVVRARPPAKIVAFIGLPLASEALVLDSREHPELRSLADLAGGDATVLAHSPASAAFVDRLASLLDSPALGSASELRDDATVFAELERDGGAIVAGAMREPWISKARAAGMTVVVSALDVPLADVEVLVASDQILARDPALVEAVVTRYYAGVLARDDDPGKLVERAATAYGLTEGQAERALARLCLFDSSGAAPWFSSDGPPTTEELGDLLEPRFTLAAARGQIARGSPTDCLASSTRAKPSQPLGALLQPTPERSPFEPNTATLAASGPEIVAQIAATLRHFNPATVSAEIIGFGDRPGNAGRKLGRARAERLVEALGGAGVPLELIATGGDGRAAPPSRFGVVLRRTP